MFVPPNRTGSRVTFAKVNVAYSAIANSTLIVCSKAVVSSRTRSNSKTIIRKFDEFEEFDEVRISGVACSPSGFVLDNILVVISTISKDDIKVWPIDESLPGKIWISKNDIREMVLIEK